MASNQNKNQGSSSQQSSSAAAEEKQVNRNPHGNFKEIEANRPAWTSDASWTFTQTKDTSWQPGDGANDHGESLTKGHVSIDPYAEGRSPISNYKLIISAVVPRPIAFVSTRSTDGTSTNLSPFSYFQAVNHDPPVFVVGFAGSLDKAKDTLRNLVESKEACISIISEHFIEAANATSVNAPYAISEWALSGLTPAKCSVVKADRVKEAVFSIEAKLMKVEEFDSKAAPGKKSGVLAILEGIRFWAREDAINKEQDLIDPAILRPISRFGGITYSRSIEGIELPRPVWDDIEPQAESKGLVTPKLEHQ